MKKILIGVALVVTGCASWDAVTPTYVPQKVRQAAEGDIHTWHGFTTLGMLSTEVELLKIKHKFVLASAGLILDTSRTVQQNILALLAVLGVGGAAVGIPVAHRMPPPTSKPKKI